MPNNTPTDEQELRELLLSFGQGMYVQDPDEGIFTPIRWEESPLLEKYVQSLCALLARSRAMHLCDLARAVGLLEGMGYPDEYLAKRLAALESTQGDKYQPLPPQKARIAFWKEVERQVQEIADDQAREGDDHVVS